MRWMISLSACLFLFLFVPGCPTTPPGGDDDDNDDSASDDDTGDDDTGDDDTGDDDTGDDDTGDDDTGGNDPNLTVDPAEMDFGLVCIGEPAFMQLRLINDGGHTLVVSGMNDNIGPLQFDEFSGEIAAGASEIVGVTTGCPAQAVVDGEIHVFSNDPDSPDTTVIVGYVCDAC